MNYMLRTIIERYDLYLLMLCIISGAMVAYFDAERYKNEKKHTAYKQAKYFGFGLIVFSVALYIVRFIIV